MHEELRRLVDAEWGKVSEQLAEAYRLKSWEVREDAARRGLIEDSWFATLNAYLEYAKSLCEERARIWADNITRSKGRFEGVDATFVERDVAAMLDTHREGAQRVARESGGVHASPAVIQQRISLWSGGTDGSIRRDLSVRVGDSTLSEKEEERKRVADEAKEFPLSARILLGRRLQRPFARQVYAWVVVGLAVVGAWDVLVSWLLPFFKLLARWLTS